MRHVAEREGEELLALSVLAVGGECFGLLDKRLTERRGSPVVAHVAPEEELLVESLLHARVEPRKNVDEGEKLFLGDRLQCQLQLVEYDAELTEHTSG